MKLTTSGSLLLTREPLMLNAVYRFAHLRQLMM